MRLINLLLRSIILCLALTNSSFIFAKQIDSSTAEIAALHFLQNHTQISKLNSNLNLVRTIGDPVSGQNYMYVFSINPTGFILISGDDIVYPVLAYSAESSIPEILPNNVAKWIENYKAQIRFAIQKNLSPSEEITNLWSELISGNPTYYSNKKGSVAPLLDTKWDQSPYYNSLCPYDPVAGERAVTGCVATAMAQIMKFWNFPSSGSGFHSYNHSKYGTLSANFASTSYTWSSMPNYVTSENLNVAQLMYHCGVSVDMNYGVDGSSASTLNVADALKSYFGYSSSVTGVARNNYSESSWISLLKSELDAGRPVQYAGTGTEGGHSFVCDGYDNNSFFHFNWGWGGSSDGYFLINALNPGSLGTGGGSGGFNSNQRAVIGIKPPSGQINYSLDITEDVTVSSSSIVYGSPFSVSFNVTNKGTSAFNGDFGAAIFDQNNVFIQFVEVLSNKSLQGGYTYSVNPVFSNPGSYSILPGDYSIYIYYRPTGGSWKQLHASGLFTDDMASLNVYYDNTIELSSVLSPLQSTFIQGQPASVSVNLTNTGNSTFYGKYAVSLNTLDGQTVSYIDSIEEFSGLPANYTYSNPLTFSTSSLSVSPGTYLLAVEFYTNSTAEWDLAGSTRFQNPILVTVMESPFQPDKYEPNNSVATAKPLPLSFAGSSASINTSGANCHTGIDYDYFKFTLPSGYNYSILPILYDSYSTLKDSSFSLDALFSFSTDGVLWSEAYDDIIPTSISIANGGNLYIKVSPYFEGESGTYQLSISANRTSTSGNEEPNLQSSVSVFPNPTDNVVFVTSLNSAFPITSIDLLNLQGDFLTSFRDIHSSFNSLNLADLPTGIYLLKISSNNNTSIQKIVLTK